jgi:hypothetical protein
MHLRSVQTQTPQKCRDRQLIIGMRKHEYPSLAGLKGEGVH